MAEKAGDLALAGNLRGQVLLRPAGIFQGWDLLFK